MTTNGTTNGPRIGTTNGVTNRATNGNGSAAAAKVNGTSAGPCPADGSMAKEQAGVKEEESAALDTSGPAKRCRFNLTPPRHFLYPAILLLIAEEPRHGYRLMDAILRLGLGAVDRPNVYRALGDLESDGLLSSWSAAPTAGSTRHVYGLTETGRETLSSWMSVLRQQRDALARVVDRYAAVPPAGAVPEPPPTEP